MKLYYYEWAILLMAVLLSLQMVCIISRKLANKRTIQRGHILDGAGIILFEVVNGVGKEIRKFPIMGEVSCVEHMFSYRPPKMKLNEFFDSSDLMPGEGHIETLDLTNVRDNIFGRIPGLEGRGIKKIKVRAKFDGNVYTVRDFGDYQQAAELLAKLNKDAKKLIAYLQENYPNNSYTLALAKNYNGDLEEETPKNLENLTSYTVDKQKIISCLRTKEGNHDLHDYNLLLYVFIHEMSHMANDKSFGHDANFDNSFEFLLKRADEIKILKRINFEKNPQNFCGLPIKSNVDY